MTGALWVACGLAAGPAESVVPDAVRARAIEASDAPLAERIDRVSGAMLGHPYVNDPFGEGSGHDPDPLVRYDAFDCLTFVEEVLALTLGADPDHTGEIRAALRYGAGRSYAQRNHFMELQWIPSAIEAGWVLDTTADYGAPTTRLERVVDDATWSAWRSRERFALTTDELPRGRMALDVITIDDAIPIAAAIRPGTIVLTVRADRAWSPIWVSHLGLVVPGSTPTVRHATKMGDGRTRDHGLVWYLEHLRTYDNWPVVGISLLEPVDFGPRISRLPTEAGASQ